jgi:8-oxo-dGTP diphosphatase
LSVSEDHGVVQAAGCVLWRRRRSPYGDGGIELCLVHRPKYDDWSFPKGKLKRGEDPRDCARREVLEETGMECELGAALPTSRYLAQGSPKEVRYWAAEATAGTFVPDEEVDRALWLSPTAARHRITQERDRVLVDALLAVLEQTQNRAGALGPDARPER